MLLATDASPATQISVANELDGGRVYIFLLRVENFLGASSDIVEVTVLRDALAIPTITITGPPLHAPVTPPRVERSAVQHKPLTLEEAAEEASHNAAVAQKLAYMRSPQYWQSQQATHTTKRYGMMPGLPLLAPLDPAAADE